MRCTSSLVDPDGSQGLINGETNKFPLVERHVLHSGLIRRTKETTDA
ncbi:MAG: hypothetical protein RLY30_1910 [Pseudomonadota bacterium]|jgi:hypothetical protein